MKLLYGFMLLFGLFAATGLSFVRIRGIDPAVATALSESPGRWTISVDQDLAKPFAPDDIKMTVFVALLTCASAKKDANLELASLGTWLIVFSTIALMREVKIDRLRRALGAAEKLKEC